ncbi:protein kinase [Candidatus Uabimicrobium sp. HlEnr_7]|uniref:protein kinase domain-containing protein n=1 Tax=Candidatus Uabimicrobium helgolandensis TaxID=3095367 RepID=UPI003555D269
MSLFNNRYIIKKIIGQGGMGKVYLATDTQTSIDVAIKECILGSEGTKRNIERIKREYYFMKKINHPSVIKGHDFFVIKDRYFIVMEYIEGIDLKTFINQKKYSISFDHQLEIAKYICGAVATLNNNGVIHRDIKPANIILQGTEFKPILLDLGIAKSINNELATLTQAGNIVGTPEYISPEQVHGKKDLLNSDVFSLGVLLYQFFTWMPKSPFDAGNKISTIYKICKMQLPPLAEIIKEPNLNLNNLSKVVQNAIRKNPQQRTHSVEKMLYDLLDIKTNGQETQYFKPMKETSLSKLRKKKRRQIKITQAITSTAIIICCTLLIAIMYKLYFFPKKKTEISQEMGSLYAEAMLYEYQGKQKLALNTYNKTIAENPKHFKAYASRGHLYYVKKKYALAKRDYDKSIAINTKYPNVYKARGNWYRNFKKYTLAKQDYDRAIELNPTYAQAYRARAHLHRDQENYDQAERDYSLAIKADPLYVNAYRSRGNLYKRIKKMDLAQKDYDAALKINPKDAEIYYYKGIVHHMQNEFVAAEKNYKTAIKLDSQYFQSYQNMGLIYYQQRKYHLAIDHWKTAIKLGLPEKEIHTLMQKAQKYVK